MDSTSRAQRKPGPQTGAAAGLGVAGLRDMIQQAISAYELAVAAQLRTGAEAQHRHEQRLADLDAHENAEASQRETSVQDEQAVATAEAQRVEGLAALAEDLTQSASGLLDRAGLAGLARSASSLLDRAALAYVRGFGPGAADVAPHLATDEQVAAAFTAAQLASVDLRAAVLRLAGEYVRARDWQRARAILAALLTGPPGALSDETATLFRTACLEEARETLANGEQERARDLAATWLQSHPHDTGFTVLLDEVSSAIRDAWLRQVREMLAGRDVEQAREQALAWLREHRGDTDVQESLLQATITLAERALASADQARAAELTAAARQAGAGDPRLQALLRRHPAVAWRAGGARLLYDFGGHSQPVRDLAFTADRNHLVAVDGTEVKTWNLAAPAQGRLERTVPAAGVCGLTPDGLLALSRNGELCRTNDASRVRRLGANANAAHAFSADGSLAALTARTAHWQLVMTYSSGRYRVTGVQGQSDRTRPGVIISQLGRYSYTLESSKAYGGASIGSSGSSGQAHFVGQVAVVDIGSGQQICSITLDQPQIFLDVALSASTRKVATLTPDGEVTVTDIDSCVRTHVFSVAPAQSLLNSIAFSPAGDLLLVTEVGGKTTQVTIWDISTGSVSWSWQTQRLDGAVAFSPDGQLVAALATDGTVSLFDVRARQALPAIGTHGAVTSPCLAFSRDGSRLATSGDRSVKVWGL